MSSVLSCTQLNMFSEPIKCQQLTSAKAKLCLQISPLSLRVMNFHLRMQSWLVLKWKFTTAKHDKDESNLANNIINDSQDTGARQFYEIHKKTVVQMAPQREADHIKPQLQSNKTVSQKSLHNVSFFLEFLGICLPGSLQHLKIA